MSPTSPASPEASAPDPASSALQTDADQALDELAAVLAEETQLAREGDLDSVQSLVAKTDVLLRRLAGAGPLALPAKRKLDQIARVHSRIELLLAAAKQETATRLERLRHGKSALRAYGGRNSP